MEQLITCPWDKDEEDSRLIQDWMIDYVTSKDVPLDYLKKPSDKKVTEQLHTLVRNLLGPRNFVLLLSRNPAHTWALYFYLATIWVTTTSKGFYILDVKELDVNYANEIIPKIEATSLLIIPYVDPQGWDLRRKRNILGNILAKRKARKQPFITDFYLKNIASDERELLKSIQPITNVFGEQAGSFFLQKQSNSKIIKIKEK